MSEGPLEKCFEYISTQVYENPGMSEDELYSVLDRSGFFERLGYMSVGFEYVCQKDGLMFFKKRKVVKTEK